MDIITDNSFKYNLEKLDSTSDEFILVKQFFDTTKIIKKSDSTKASESRTPAANLQIYKVNENNLIEPTEEKRNNLMLFHGTNRKGAVGILKEGFRNSTEGWFGQGIYMTDCSRIALMYSCISNNYNTRICNYVFVNEVLESEKLQTFEIRGVTGVDKDTPLKCQFSKHTYKTSIQATEEDYREDHKGRKYRNVGHKKINSYSYGSANDEYVAEESVTIPRYLIIYSQI